MMRFTVDARAFSDAMSKVSKVLRKNPIPILEEIAVCIQNGRCTLTATDLETWLVAELPARGDDMSFVFSRTKDVMKACAHFEGELAITFVPKDEKDGKIEVLCEQRAAEFSTASYEDYPECGTVEEGASLRVNAAALFHRIERVRYAAEKGCLDRRPQSACVQFREDRIFSLDGRRMACDAQPDTVFPVPCLLLGDALTHLRAFGENEVAVQIGAHKVCFSDETLKLYVRRYGVDTYDPDAAIPKVYREVITVQTDELLRELTYLKECVGSCTFPYRLTPDICRILVDNFEDLSVWRFTDSEFKKFKQVAIFGVRKHRNAELQDTLWLEQLACSPASIPTLEKIDEGRYPEVDEEDPDMIMYDLLWAFFDEEPEETDDEFYTVRFSDQSVDRLYQLGCQDGDIFSSQLRMWQEKIKDTFLFYVVGASHSVFDVAYYFGIDSVKIDITLSPDCYEPLLFLNSIINMILYCQKEVRRLEAERNEQHLIFNGKEAA